jgi:uncharacterized protein
MSLEVIFTIIMSALALSSLILLPGPFLVAVASGIYGLQTSFDKFTVGNFVVFLIFGITAFFLDNLMVLLGAKKLGASKYGLYGAFIGTILIFVLGPLGLLFGPFLGALIGEVAFAKTKPEKAVRAAIGAVLGMLSGIFAKFLLAIILVIWFGLIVF